MVIRLLFEFYKEVQTSFLVCGFVKIYREQRRKQANISRNKTVGAEDGIIQRPLIDND